MREAGCCLCVPQERQDSLRLWHDVSVFFLPLQYEWDAPMRLNVGDSCCLTKSFNAADVRHFGQASHDWNPVHYPEMHAVLVQQQTAKWRADPATANLPLPKTGIFRFHAPIVHGLLTSSLIGTLFAHHLPGAIYLNQSLQFKAPVYYDEKLTARIEVTSVDRTRVTCRTTVEKTDKDGKVILVIDGEAKVLVEALEW